MMLLMQKLRFSGEFEKLKAARYVAGGHTQLNDEYDASETSTPIVSLSSMWTAYLNAKMMREVHMRIEPELAKPLAGIDSVKYSQDYVQLDKAPYGCLESSELWFDEKTFTLKGLGVVAHAKDSYDIDWLAEQLEEKYKTVTVSTGQTFSLQRSEGLIRGHFDLGDVTKCRESRDCSYEVPNISEWMSLEESTQAKFMYLAECSRQDIILTATAFLSCRLGKANREDLNKLERNLKYLNSSVEQKMVLCAEDELRIYAFVDASFAVYSDTRSHTWAVISLGREGVGARGGVSRAASGDLDTILPHRAGLRGVPREAAAGRPLRDFLLGAPGSTASARGALGNRGAGRGSTEALVSKK
jgi:hypothetical protein